MFSFILFFCYRGPPWKPLNVMGVSSLKINYYYYYYNFFCSEASQWFGILNPWIWLANDARSSGPVFLAKVGIWTVWYLTFPLVLLKTLWKETQQGLQVSIIRRQQTQRKMSLKLCISVLLFYFAILPTLLTCLIWPNCPGTEFRRDGVQVQGAKKNSRPCLPKTHKTGHFTLLFCRARQRNVAECITHLQTHCFAS